MTHVSARKGDLEQAGKIKAFLDEEGFDWNRGINTAAGLLLILLHEGRIPLDISEHDGG